MTDYTFSTQDVLDAQFADSCAAIAQAEQTTVEDAATYALHGMDGAEDARAENLAILARGQEILQRARLVTGPRFRCGTATPRHLIATDAPVVEVSAGYIAHQEAVREYTLVQLAGPQPEYQYWDLLASGETYAVRIEGGTVTSCVGPLAYDEIDPANIELHEYDDQDWLDDAENLNPEDYRLHVPGGVVYP